MADKVFSTAKELKTGRYVMIDGVPCKVVQIDISKPGKHGAAKMRVVGIGVFDGQKKVLLTPSDADIEVPIIERKTAQIVSVNGSVAQLMDAETYEMFDLEIPEEYLQKAESGREVDLITWAGKKKVEGVR